MHQTFFYGILYMNKERYTRLRENNNMSRQIINIINFIRGCEPRTNADLVKPVKEQIALMDRHNLSGTFLIQYDALIQPRFTEMLLPLDSERYEIGVWYELNQPLVEKAGIEWTGKYPWDWHAHCGFSVGYTEAQREAMLDILFEDFKAVFGYYPRTLGSWAFDAHSIEYAGRKYGITAACICKEQWGTDGYNLWGGYYGQAYYPSRTNVYAPAQKTENQIDVPIFRMLGSDHVMQYDFGLDVNSGIALQGVITLEPVYAGNGGGGVPKWVDWYMKENFNGKCLTFGYAQAGQENSFGWDMMKNGLENQFAVFRKLQDEGKISVEKFCDSGKWYRGEYKSTPASTLVADSDWLDEGRRSVWYSCKNYRCNLYEENNRFWIRDIYLYRDEYRERYLGGNIEKTDSLTYDDLPVIDGARYSGSGIRAGLYPTIEGKTPVFSDMKFEDLGNGCAKVTFITDCGDVVFTMTEECLDIFCEKELSFTAEYCADAALRWTEKASADDDHTVTFRYNGFDYGISLTSGKLDGFTASSVDGHITFKLN